MILRIRGKTEARLIRLLRLSIILSPRVLISILRMFGSYLKHIKEPENNMAAGCFPQQQTNANRLLKSCSFSFLEQFLLVTGHNAYSRM